MKTPLKWTCPGCGATVALPAECGAAGKSCDYRRLDQLAQALCGCWVVKLPDRGLARLLRAIITGDDGLYDDQTLGIPGTIC